MRFTLKSIKTAGTVLKVVGASWQKTRIGTYILIGAGLLVIGAFFISYVERPEYDGTYCATAFWTKQFGFQIEYWKQQNDLLNIPKGAARICYKDSIYENGLVIKNLNIERLKRLVLHTLRSWAQIEIETQRTSPDWVQAYGAGVIEGSLTWNQIYNQWLNTIMSSCDRDENAQHFCTWLRELLENNFNEIKETAASKSEHDHYWHQINLYFIQLKGLETGYRQGAKRARSDLEGAIPWSDFLLMNSAADIHDLKIYYENYILNGINRTTDETEPKNFFLPSATMITKIYPTGNASTWQLLFGHSSAGSYTSMLRIQKRYKFHYHIASNQNSNTVPGMDIAFTGYPGILASTDDFYIIKGRQVHAIVAGVGIKNENLELWQTVNVQKAMPLAARVMAANRLAQSRRSWTKALSRHPFTGSKQWITIDLNKLSPLESLYELDENNLELDEEAASIERQNHLKGLVWIAEQLPGRMHMRDVSAFFLQTVDNSTTWLASGIPYYKEILEASCVNNEAYVTNLTTAESRELTNLEAIDKFLRTRGFRGDLLDDEQSVAYGNIDIKLFAYNARLGMSDYHAFAGPVFIRLQHVQTRSLPAAMGYRGDLAPASLIRDDRLSVVVDDAAELAELQVITERRIVRDDMRAVAMSQISSSPFKWSSVAEKMATLQHAGHPDEWNFGKVSPKWAW
uniref:Phospholipase B-like n=1 Tax=Glossina pallidipes TaxID=7398 RepID=A0A1B0AEW9_GLOPL